MRILCVFGRHNYGDPSRGEGLEYSQFLPALRTLGHEVDHFESFSRSEHQDFAALNRALLLRVEAWRPDLVFTVLMMAEIWTETIQLIRANGVRVVNWATDDSWKYREFSRLIAPEFDLWLTTCPDAEFWYAADGLDNVLQTQWAASSSWLAIPRSASECRYSVSFLGSAYGTRPMRIASLLDAGIAVECFGHGWPNGPLSAERIPEIIRDSVVSLNFSDPGHGTAKQIKARVFEVPGAGGMLLTETAPSLDRYFSPDAEIALFLTDQELATKLHALLNDPELRDSIAVAGHARVVKEHTYEKRMAQVLERMKKEKLIPPNIDPRGIDWARFEVAARRHKVGWGLKLIRACLVIPCALIWGPVRGRRAARRILFEISWRVAGPGTYSASGWPGRMFYTES